jgi:DNA-binding FadR family transcriptional regulator
MSSEKRRNEEPMRGSGPVVVPRTSRADVAAEALRKLIMEGRFSGALPGVRFLAEALGVGIPTVSAALQRLREEGWIESRGER